MFFVYFGYRYGVGKLPSVGDWELGSEPGEGSFIGGLMAKVY